MKTINDLQKAIKGTIQTTPATNSNYSIDKSNLEPIQPKYVITVKSATDIPAILTFANTTNTPITSWGAGSGKSGGAIPEPNGIILSFENMNNILNVDPQNKTITVEPGVIVNDIKTAAEKINMFYPPDPASSDWCTIGGCVAENAGGPCSVKYGVTGDYVLGLEGYLGNGDFVSFGGKTHKNVAGYDIKRLLIGQEGTLAIITKITLKLIPKPRHTASYWCQFNDTATATQFLTIMSQSNCHFSAVEFLDPHCLAAAKQHLNLDFPWLNKVGVLMAYDSDATAGLATASSLINKHCTLLEGSLYTKDQTSFWTVRRSISEALKSQYKAKCSEDITVPPAQIKDLLTFLTTLETPHIKCLGYGHLGDGNVHVNILNIDLPNNKWQQEKQTITAKIMTQAITLGGTLTGEHGIGLTKKQFMPLYFSKTELHLLKSIKKLCDPNNILNPSKIFSDDNN